MVATHGVTRFENQGHGPTKKNQAAVATHGELPEGHEDIAVPHDASRILKAGAGLAARAPYVPRRGKAPAQGGKKPFEGTTLNVSCWSSTYPTLLAQYIPEFTEKTGIKVGTTTRPASRCYGQRLPTSSCRPRAAASTC